VKEDDNSTKELVDFEISNGEWIKVGKLPRRSCKHCYGRGWEGHDRSTGERIICRCTRRR